MPSHLLQAVSKETRRQTSCRYKRTTEQQKRAENE